MHRVSYHAFIGPIPEGQIVMHICDTPPCCNPSHLVAGTWKDNTADMWEKGRHPRPAGELNGMFGKRGANYKQYGEMHPSHKLTDDQVREIHSMYAQGSLQREIGAKFGITSSRVSELLQGKYWPHIHQEIHNSLTSSSKLDPFSNYVNKDSAFLK